MNFPLLFSGGILLAVVCQAPLARAEVTHGSELVKGKNCGIPEGTQLEASGETTFKEPAVIENKILGSVTTTHSDGVVKFVRCKFVNPGFVSMSEGEKATPGTAYYTVQRKGTGSVELEDCEVYGGTSVAVLNVDKMLRTYIAEGNDLIRVPKGESFYTEVLAEKLLMNSPQSHSDVLQATFNEAPADNPSVADIHLLRCRFDARGRTDEDGNSLDPVNGAIQFGGFKANSGAKGVITDCAFEGGSFTLQIGAPKPPSEPLVLRGNTFGRKCKYGPARPGLWEGHDMDESNVWADTRQPAKGKP